MYLDPVLFSKLRKRFLILMDTFAQYIFKKNYGPFLWMGLSCLKTTESLRGDSLFFTNYSLGDSGTHLLDFHLLAPIAPLFPNY